MITTLLFSRDRAMQVDATLQSFLRHCVDKSNLQVNVLFATSSDQHARQYTELIENYKQYPDIRFLSQKDFRQDVFTILNPYRPKSLSYLIYRTLVALPPRLNRMMNYCLPSIPKERLALFLVDDNLFVRNFSLNDATQALKENPDSIGFSLRLSQNTTYCYSHDAAQPLPPFTHAGQNILKFNWTCAEEDFKYPLEISSSIYRLKDFIPLILRFQFSNPNFLESGIASRWRWFENHLPALLCFERSVTFCNPVNMVQTVSKNRASTSQHTTAKELADKFDQGLRIDVATYDGFTPIACHQEVDLHFKKV